MPREYCDHKNKLYEAADRVLENMDFEAFGPDLDELLNPYRAKPKWYLNLIFRLKSFWIGWHYSYKYQSHCIALIPCVVIRIARTPYEADNKECR